MHGVAIEFQLIDFLSGVCHGGFISLRAARDHARAEGLSAWDIWRHEYPPQSIEAVNSRRVELHNPAEPQEQVKLPVPKSLRKRSPEEFEAMAEEARALAETRLDARTRELMVRTADAYMLMASAAKLIRESAS